MFAYPCPSCSQQLLAPVDRAGHRSVCPTCLRPLTVPHPGNRTADPFGPSPAGWTVHAVETPLPATTDGPPADAHSDLAARAEASVADLGDLGDDRGRFETIAVSEQAAGPPGPFAALLGPPGAARRQSSQERDGRVPFDPAARDAAAELRTTISLRPPPLKPASDRGVVLGGWLFGLFTGVGVWVLGVLAHPGWGPYTAVVGIAMIGSGLVWRAYLSGRGGRPLLLVATGAALCGLSAVGPKLVTAVGHALGVNAAQGPVAVPTEPAPATTAEGAAEQPRSRDIRDAARKALITLGPAAEPAVLPLLRSDSESTVLAACEVLEQIGGPDARAALRTLADTTPVRAVRVQATEAIEAIGKRPTGAK